MKKFSMLSFIGKSLETFGDRYIYSSHNFVPEMQIMYPGLSEEHRLWLEANIAKIFNTHKYLCRVKHVRHRYGYPSIQRANEEQANQNAKKRYDDLINQIATLSPMQWTRHLNSFQNKVAKRLRPEGECLGIELEFLAVKDSDIVSWDEDDYHNHPFLHFKGDSSVNTSASDQATARFQELTYFMNSQDPKDWKRIKDVLQDMTDSGAIVNQSCGNHVHLDMRHRSHSSALRTASKVREAINNWGHRLVSFNRSNNHYCGINREHQGNRYTAVNIQCLGRHNTVEVRLGMPTLNFYKLKYWSQFLQYLATPRTSCSTFEDFMQSDAPVDLKHYAFKRILKFQNTYTNHNLQPLPGFENYSTIFNSIDGGIE
jgi:hypothetical protein